MCWCDVIRLIGILMIDNFSVGLEGSGVNPVEVAAITINEVKCDQRGRLGSEEDILNYWLWFNALRHPN